MKIFLLQLLRKKLFYYDWHSLKLDIGCSFHKKSGYIGVDLLKTEDVDVVADACQMPFADSTFDGIYTSHCIEHISDQLSVISEMWRVCERDSEIHILVPHFSNPSYFDDLTHQHKYSTRSFEHYDHKFHAITGHPNYLPNVNLTVESVRLNYWPPRIILLKSWHKATILRVVAWLFDLLANMNHFFCERFWCKLSGGFFEVEYKIKVIK